MWRKKLRCKLNPENCRFEKPIVTFDQPTRLKSCKLRSSELWLYPDNCLQSSDLQEIFPTEESVNAS